MIHTKTWTYLRRLMNEKEAREKTKCDSIYIKLKEIKSKLIYRDKKSDPKLLKVSGVERIDCKKSRTTSGVCEIFYILIMVMVIQVYILPKGIELYFITGYF